jgi:hypothetical protein
MIFSVIVNDYVLISMRILCEVNSSLVYLLINEIYRAERLMIN